VLPPAFGGLGPRENASTFVSKGIGTVYVLVSIICPPELAIINLERRSQI
jgi:predicted MPP superfamily phosphohydrolase